MIGRDTAAAFSQERLDEFLRTLERVAAGDVHATLPISQQHDELDAIAFGINVLADELRFAHARMTETERQKAGELRDALAHLGRVAMLDVLTGSLAHEVSQPLTAAVTNAAAALHLLSTQPPRLEDLRHTLIDILNETKRAADVLQRMRQLLKKGATQHQAVDVNEAAQDIVQLMHANAVARRISLDVKLGSNIAPVPGDRIQIQQVVLNLLMNAFDAVQEREPAARRVTLRTSSDDAATTIDVSDQGPGLSEEAVAALFEPFHTTKKEGLGLGLWICRGIAASHGGSLDARPNRGIGMTFSARFPLRRQER